MAALFAWFFLVVGGVLIVGQLVGSALFLSALPPSAVAFKYLGPAVALVLVSGQYVRLSARVPRQRLIAATIVGATTGLLGFRAALGTGAGSTLPVLGGLYVFIEVAAFLLVYQFWNVAQDLFDAREAKRHFSLVAGGGTLASVVAGGGLQALSRVLAPADLLFVLMGALGLLGVLVAWVFRRWSDRLGDGRPPPPTADAPARDSLRAELLALGESPLLVTMSLLVLTLTLVSNIAEYQFDLAVQARFGDRGEDMVAFLGSFRMWTAGVVGAAVQLFVASRLLGRFGVVGGLMVMPAAIGLGAVGALATAGSFALLVLPRATDYLLKFSLYDSTFNLLYLPVRRSLRARAKLLLAEADPGRRTVPPAGAHRADREGGLRRARRLLRRRVGSGGAAAAAGEVQGVGHRSRARGVGQRARRRRMRPGSQASSSTAQAATASRNRSGETGLASTSSIPQASNRFRSPGNASPVTARIGAR